MHLKEEFIHTVMPGDFTWLNEPSRYTLGAGLEIYTDPGTDFWQTTHYGFQRDNGHCLLTRCSKDFSLSTRVEFNPRQQYDQCGLMVRIDHLNWIKVSTEYENQHTSRLGSVVTNLGFSDWATQDIPSTYREMCYRISKRGGDFLLEHSYDGWLWHQLRITHLHQPADVYQIGVYACSPIGRDYWCRFKSLEIAENEWQASETSG